jgi:hypothetical protein
MNKHALKLRSLTLITIAVALVAMWTRSVITEDHVQFLRGAGLIAASSGEGRVTFCRKSRLTSEAQLVLGNTPIYGSCPAMTFDALDRWDGSEPTLSGDHDEVIEGPLASFAGFAWQTTSVVTVPGGTPFAAWPRTGRPNGWLFAIPYWAILVPVIMLTWHSVARWRRLKLSQNICLKCGYDLRATPGRCPECGTEQPSAATLPKPANS